MKKFFVIVLIFVAMLLVSCSGNEIEKKKMRINTDGETYLSVNYNEIAARFGDISTNAELLRTDKMEFTQAMCISEDYVFIAFGKYNGNGYKLRKLDRDTMEVIAESDRHFNHANGITYNKDTNELIICSLDGRSGKYKITGDQDYGFFIVDADTLELKRTLNIKDIVLGIAPDLCGVSEIAYNNVQKRYYVATHYPYRYIIVLNDDFTLNHYMYMRDFYDPYGLYGDMSCDDEHLYFCRWIIEQNQLLNVVDKYTLDGEYISSNYVYGITHIEAVAIDGNECYANFIDFSNKFDLKLYKFNLNDEYIRLN